MHKLLTLPVLQMALNILRSIVVLLFLFINLIFEIQISHAQDNIFFNFETEIEKINFLEKVLTESNLSDENKGIFDEHTGFAEKKESLPPSPINRIYNVLRIGSLVTDLGALIIEGQIDSLEDSLDAARTTVSAANGIIDATSLVDAVENITDSFERVYTAGEIFHEMDLLTKIQPGHPIRLLEADYAPFVELFKILEIIKALETSKLERASKLKEAAVAKSVFHFVLAARLVSGLKKATGGEFYALNLEALLGSVLIELNEVHRNLILKSWKQGIGVIIKTEVSWLSGKREVLEQESMQLIEAATKFSDEKIASQLNSKTYSAKAGALLVGALQENARPVDLALNTLENAGFSNASKARSLANGGLGGVIFGISKAESSTRSAIQTVYSDTAKSSLWKSAKSVGKIFERKSVTSISCKNLLGG